MRPVLFVAHYGEATIDGKSTEFLAFDPAGDAPPEVIAGRLPRSADEVALGAGLLDELDLHLGSTATFTVAGGEFAAGGRATPRPLTVVGEALPPVFGESDFAEVGVVTLDAIAAAGGDDAPRMVLVRVGGDDTNAALTAMDRDYTEEIATDAVPARIFNLHRVRPLPILGLAAAGLLGIVPLVYAMAVSMRARMRDLAVLRALGLSVRRLRRVLAWEGTVLALATVFIGLPVGLLLGSALWGRVTEQLGVSGGAVVTPLILFLGPLAGLLAVLASLYPARRAGREQIASLLHAE